jgi:hypothetical protein
MVPRRFVVSPVCATMGTAALAEEPLTAVFVEGQLATIRHCGTSSRSHFLARRASPATTSPNWSI